jgi:hypothetical protein
MIRLPVLILTFGVVVARDAIRLQRRLRGSTLAKLGTIGSFPMTIRLPPNPGRRRTAQNGTAPPPQPDGKWDFMREQRATQTPPTKTHSSKIAIFIVALTFFFICSVLAYLVFPNRVFMILVGGFAAQWLWRGLWKPQPGKIASTIGITILVLLCFLFFYSVAILLIHNAAFAIVSAGFAACWFWRGLRRVNFLGTRVNLSGSISAKR